MIFQGLKAASPESKCPICREVCILHLNIDISNDEKRTTLDIALIKESKLEKKKTKEKGIGKIMTERIH